MSRIVSIGVGVVAATALLASSAPAQDEGVEAYSLRRAIETALTNSRLVDAAEAAVDRSGQQVREAWSSALPDIRATMSYSRNFQVQEAFLPAIIFDPSAGPDDLIPVRFGSDNTWQAQVNMSQPLFEVSVFTGVGAAGRFRDLQLERLRGTTQDVVSAVRLAYFDALLALEEWRLTRQSLERVQQTLAETRALQRAGLASDYDVLRLEVQEANLEATLLQADNAVTAASRRLLVELGLDPSTPIRLEGRLNEVDLGDLAANTPANRDLLALSGVAAVDTVAVERLLRTAVHQRSDLRQLRSTITLEESRFAVERAEFFPKLEVFSNYSVTAQQNGGPNFFGRSNERTSSLVGGLRVELPIFTGMSRAARMSQAKANVLENEAQLERAEHDAVNEVRTLLEGLAASRLRSSSQQRAVAQARRGFEIASAEYRAGVGSQLQITDAEVALRESEFNYARAVYDYLTTRARLERALGLVPEEHDALPDSGSGN